MTAPDHGRPGVALGGPTSHLDAALYALDTPTNHMHMGLLVIFDRLPDGCASGDDVAALLRARIVADPSAFAELRLVLRSSSFGIARPVKVDAGPPDLAVHVRAESLPGPMPGSTALGDEALDVWVGAHLSVPLDRSRPLWEVTVVTGLTDGRVALLVKGHHVMFDGMTALRMTLRVLDRPRSEAVVRSPAPRTVRSSAHAVVAPDRWRSGWDLVGWPARLARLALSDARWRVRARVERARTVQGPSAGASTPARMFGAPRTQINRSIGSKRVVARVVLPVQAIRAVRKSARCTGNDVVLTAVSTALREVLAGRSALPRRSLTAIVPSAHGDPDVEWGGRSGNRLSFWFVSLATDVDDVRQRLGAIAVSSKLAREIGRRRGYDLWNRYASTVPSGVVHVAVRCAELLHLSDWLLPPLGSLIVSNLAGPRHPLTLGGASLSEMWPFGPPKDGGGINVTLVSYGDVVHVGVQGDAALAQDVEALARRLPGALREVVEAVVS